MGKHVIGLSSFTADPVGNRMVYVDAGTLDALNQGRRRVSRTKTLDGAAVIYDAGYSPSDLTLTISTPTTNATTAAFFAMLVKTYNLIRVCTDSGVYSAAPSQWREEDGMVTLEALVKEQLA